MIGRITQDQHEGTDATHQEDEFALKLGDVMRGERATLGKSLLDVQRELRIKASYISAIENCDPGAFDTPGFIAGYVRSYARYLGMDPDEAFGAFCKESGFSVAHGMSQDASVVRKPTRRAEVDPARPRNPLSDPKLPFAPKSDSFLSRIEPGAVGSSLVLIALIAGIGYGGWSVLKEIQRVQVTPVDQTPVVLSQLDPLDAATAPRDDTAEAEQTAGLFTPPSSEAFDRLYRPQALDVPVLVARDAPISTLDPDSVGVFRGSAGLPRVQDSSRDPVALAQTLSGGAAVPQSGVSLIAARAAWVEVKDQDGQVILSRNLAPGDVVEVPRNAQAPRMVVGEAGALYFNVAGTVYGPAGKAGFPVSDIPLDAKSLTARYTPAEAGTDTDLLTVMVAQGLSGPAQAAPVAGAPSAPVQLADVADAPQPQTGPGAPKVFADARPGVTVVAVAETWVEVTAPSGKKLLAQVLQAGDTYHVPQTDQPPVIFSGNAGGVYFAVNGKTFGPYGPSGQFGRNLALSADAVTQKMQVADLTRNTQLAKVVAELNLKAETPGQ
ncbi:RodZ domain-containing protein [Tropicibacter alexandrii]|uniref:RodZ domain-containing protein n=1 Tax=Tropicibacter alexandrii TaxID=2267683 RepID=UPI000EF45A4A|nr:RodZ domain-containing protein [Tropicibacter alexandrii]